MTDVVIKSRSDCQFCDDAKSFLVGMEIEFTEETQDTGTVPQIIVDGANIGGYQDLVALSSSSEWNNYFKVCQ